MKPDEALNKRISASQRQVFEDFVAGMQREHMYDLLTYLKDVEVHMKVTDNIDERTFKIKLKVEEVK